MTIYNSILTPWHCPVCNAEHYEGQVEFEIKAPLGVRDKSMIVYRCVCGLCYTDYAVARKIPEVYGSYYYSHPRYMDIKGREDYVDNLSKVFNHFLIDKTVSSSSLRLLDIGCATGDFVHWALRHGYQAEGIDISEHAVSVGIKRGLPLRVDSIERFVPQFKYDIITMWDLLEHLLNPKDILFRLQKIIKPDGLLIFKTVTSNSLIDRISRLINYFSFGKIQLPLKQMYVPGHLYYFTRKILFRLSSENGWQVRGCKNMDTPPSSLFRSSGLRSVYNIISHIQKFTGTTYEIAFSVVPISIISEKTI